MSEHLNELQLDNNLTQKEAQILKELDKKWASIKWEILAEIDTKFWINRSLFAKLVEWWKSENSLKRKDFVDFFDWKWMSDKIWLVQLFLKCNWFSNIKVDCRLWSNTMNAIKSYLKQDRSHTHNSLWSNVQSNTIVTQVWSETPLRDAFSPIDSAPWFDVLPTWTSTYQDPSLWKKLLWWNSYVWPLPEPLAWLVSWNITPVNYLENESKKKWKRNKQVSS